MADEDEKRRQPNMPTQNVQYVWNIKYWGMLENCTLHPSSSPQIVSLKFTWKKLLEPDLRRCWCLHAADKLLRLVLRHSSSLPPLLTMRRSYYKCAASACVFFVSFFCCFCQSSSKLPREQGFNRNCHISFSSWRRRHYFHLEIFFSPINCFFPPSIKNLCSIVFLIPLTTKFGITGHVAPLCCWAVCGLNLWKMQQWLYCFV